jgi:cytochrome c oxidase cbb3-type subunit 4
MFSFSYEELREIQGYAFFFFVTFLTVILYGYIVHLFKSEKDGSRNYEQYSKIALDDEFTSTPVEGRGDFDKK